jgi:hypothetical protein
MNAYRNSLVILETFHGIRMSISDMHTLVSGLNLSRLTVAHNLH